MEFIDLEADEDLQQAELHRKLATSRRQSLSLFDFVVDESNERKKETVYEEKLKKELSEWFHLIKKVKSQLAETETKTDNEIDRSILLPEQIKYLEAMPNLQEFIDGSMQFQAKAYNYLHVYAETEEMKNNLAKYCVEKLERVAINNIEKYIYE